MTDHPMSADALCEHAWGYNKPAHASASVRICSLCHVIDGEDLMRTLNEYALEQMTHLKQKLARYEINYITGDTDIVTNAAGHEWSSAGLLFINDATKKTLLLAPTSNIRSVLIHDEEATD
jgi:hypothetical protein